MRADLMLLIGRDVQNEPIQFRKFTSSLRITKANGIKIYSEIGQSDFFIKSWNSSLE